MNGVIAQPGDVDCFKFPAKKGQVFDVRVLARGIRLAARLGAEHLSHRRRRRGRQRRQRRPRQLPALHRARGRHVRDHRAGSPEAGRRRLRLSRRSHAGQAAADDGPARAAASSSTSRSPCRKGNRMAFLVNASRADFGGDLNLEFKDLPPGVTVETCRCRPIRRRAGAAHRRRRRAARRARWSTSSAGTPIRIRRSKAICGSARRWFAARTTSKSGTTYAERLATAVTAGSRRSRSRSSSPRCRWCATAR